jgi:hypothetical protein
MVSDPPRCDTADDTAVGRGRLAADAVGWLSDRVVEWAAHATALSGLGAPEPSHGRGLCCSLLTGTTQMRSDGGGWALCRHRRHAQAGPWLIRQWVALRINPPTNNVGCRSIEGRGWVGREQDRPTLPPYRPSSAVLLTPGKSKYQVLAVRCSGLTRRHVAPTMAQAQRRNKHAGRAVAESANGRLDRGD